jgi:NitT/TauT family transport system ATP-binding protein
MKYSCEFGSSINLINDLSFEIKQGKVTAFLAPSGAGKSTLLKVIGGVLDRTGGEINTAPHKKAIYIPSEPASFPWFSINENFNLINDNPEQKKEIVRLLEIEGYENHLLRNDSYGFRFLVSFGMALLAGADLILIDETFKNFSSLMKERVFRTIRKTVEEKKRSVLFAASSLNDSLLISDRIIVAKGHPLSVIGDIEVSLREERNLGFLKLPAVIDLKRSIIELIDKNNNE